MRDLVMEIINAAKYMDATQRLRIMVGNYIEALEARGFSPEWMVKSRRHFSLLMEDEVAYRKQLEGLIEQHPIAAWIETSPRIGAASIGRLIGETGGLDNFPNPAKLWRYCGYSVDRGAAPRTQRGVRLTWNPRARAIMYRTALSAIRGEGRYREYYVKKRAEYVLRPRVGLSRCPFGQVHHTKHGDIIACVRKDDDGKEVSGHIHGAALRYTAKVILKDLWRAWNSGRDAVRGNTG